MKKKKLSLDMLPREYFYRKFTADFPSRKSSVMWLFMGTFLFFLLFYTAGFGKTEFPEYINVSSNIISVIVGLFVLPCVFFSSGKRIDKYIITYAISVLVGIWILQLELWIFLTKFTIVLICNGNTEGNELAVSVAFTGAVAVLLEGVIANILIYRRLKRRVVEGHFRANGKGFWKNWKLKNTLLAIIMIVGPICISLGRVSILVSKFWSLEWSESYIPFAIIFTPLILNVLFLPLAYGTALCFIRIYYIKRFGANGSSDLQISEKELN